MTARKLATCFAAACALIAPGAVAYGQAEDAFCEGCYHEQQWFAPVDFDYDCLPIERECGYFFTYDKLYWSTLGERGPLGNPDTDSATLNPFRNFLTGRAGEFDQLPSPAGLIPVTIAPPELFGGIQNSPPRAEFDQGSRYEVGYFEGDGGWSVSFLDGPEAVTGQVFGLNTQDALYGSVLVIFDDPQNLMFGFIDVWNGALGNGGPFNPDGNADDIDNDGHFGPNGYDLDAPAQVPDSNFLGDSRGDFDDLVRLPTSFQFLSVRNETESTGIEVMRTQLIDNSHFMAKNQNNQLELSYGLRYLRLRDTFNVSGTGGVMGRSFWDTEVNNNVVGPQVGLKWMHQRNRLRLDWSGRCLFGYNIENFEQEVSLGEDLIPGQYNRALYFVPTVANHGKTDTEFSPTAEMRIQANYQVTRALAFRLGYTALFVDNISRSVSQVKYELPRMGFRDDQAGGQELFINGANFGFDLVY